MMVSFIFPHNKNKNGAWYVRVQSLAEFAHKNVSPKNHSENIHKHFLTVAELAQLTFFCQAAWEICSETIYSV